MRASLADDLAREGSSKVVMYCLFLRCAFDRVLKPVQEHVEILFDVHLLNYVDWLSFPVFKRVTIGFRINVHLLRKQQARKQILPLQKHVVLVRVLVVIGVFDAKDIVSEARDHKKLLVQAVHIADAAQVFNADVSRRGLFIVIKLNVPICILLGAPRNFAAELMHVLEHFLKIFDTIAA